MPKTSMICLLVLVGGVVSYCPTGQLYNSDKDSCVPVARYLAGNRNRNEGCPMCNLKPLVDEYERFNRVKKVSRPKPKLFKGDYLVDIFDLPRYAAEIAKKTNAKKKKILTGLLDELDLNNVPIIEID